MVGLVVVLWRKEMEVVVGWRRWWWRWLILKKMMKRKKVGLVVVLWRKEMEVVVGDGGEEARPPEMGPSPATR